MEIPGNFFWCETDKIIETEIEAVTDTVETGRDIIIMLTVAENVKILETQSMPNISIRVQDLSPCPGPGHQND